MIKSIFDNLRGIHFETELLECLGWDEDRLKDTLEVLEEYFKLNVDAHPAFIKQGLSVMFDKDVTNIIFKYMAYLEKRIQHEKGNPDHEA